MEQIFSEDFRKIFLLAFTKELIKHSLKEGIKLQVKKEKPEKKSEENILEELKSPIPSKPFKPTIPKQAIQPNSIMQQKASIPSIINSFQEQEPIRQNILPPNLTRPQIPPAIKSNIRRFTKPVLFIPEPKLPEHLAYLRPTPTPGVELDLGKINPLIRDPGVRVIEGNPDERVIVEGSMGTKPTDIILSKEDIDRIINKFSEASKIPLSEGIYRVVVGNLILSSIISEVIGSKFIIKKLSYFERPQYSLPSL